MSFFVESAGKTACPTSTLLVIGGGGSSNETMRHWDAILLHSRGWMLGVLLGALCGMASLYGMADDPFPAIAQLASALSKNDAVSAMEAFDSKMKDYGSIETAVSGLTAQNEILCAIDVVEDKAAGELHTLDVDWYMQLTSQSPSGSSERRRERVILQMKKIRGKWKIISLSPISILSERNIH